MGTCPQPSSYSILTRSLFSLSASRLRLITYSTHLLLRYLSCVMRLKSGMYDAVGSLTCPDEILGIYTSHKILEAEVSVGRHLLEGALLPERLHQAMQLLAVSLCANLVELQTLTAGTKAPLRGLVLLPL